MIVLFYLFSLLAVISSIGILFIRNVFRGALLLLVSLLSLGGIFVLAFAEFVAVVQILIYAGGILVVIIFGIMLTSKIAGKPLAVTNNKWFAGLLAGGAFLTILLYLFSMKFGVDSSGHAILLQHPTPIHTIGIELMTGYLLPFEVAGILLLIALTGAAITASHKKKQPSQ